MKKIQNWILDNIEITEFIMIILLILSALSVILEENYKITIALSIVLLIIIYITPNSAFNETSQNSDDNYKI